jgi:hypothetical protein
VGLVQGSVHQRHEHDKVFTAKKSAYENLGFERGDPGAPPQGWYVPRGEPFEVTVSSDGAKEGKQLLRIHFVGKKEVNPWTSVMQAVDATPYRGKTVRLTGWVRGDGATTTAASVWLRIDCEGNRRGFFDNAQDRPVSKAEWTRIVIEGRVPADAVTINLGCLMEGPGTADFDDLTLEPVEPAPL